ncbi:MAG: autotransporter assembly complex protein TamA [Janthinobacterium lividum]
MHRTILPCTLRCLLLISCLAMRPALAADPVGYTVTLAPTGEAPLDAALRDTASLVTLRERAPVGSFALITRARADKARLEAALGSFGYYDGKATIQIAGHDLDDPALPALLDAATAPVAVGIAIARGPEYRLGRITLDGPSDPAGLAEARAALKLEPGQPALARDVLAAQGRMLEALRSSGHALAKVDTPAATLEPAAKTLNISYKVEAGPRVNLGPISIEGLDRVNESFVRRRLLIHQGQQFDPATIETARQDLAQIGVFSTVRARAADTLDAAREIPITIDVTERARHVVSATAAYSTDLGASAGVSWAHRNLFGNAEQLKLGAAATGLGGSATRRPGYDVNATFIKPDFYHRDQTLTVSLQGIKESLDAYDRTALVAGATISRKVYDGLTLSAGLLAQQSRVTQEGVTRDYTLLGVPLSVVYDTTGAAGLFEPIHGVKTAFTATPTKSLAAGSDFVVLLGTASTYVDLGRMLGGDEGRSVLALRGSLGSIQGASTFQVPPDQRFYAGGSGTVRGYKYQSVGPLFADNRPTGGTSLAAATVEYRQRFGESYGAAVFVDAGQVDTRSTPFAGNLRAGAGVGARYYTAIGPIRLDVAVPLNKQRGGDSFELYIGIGQAF